MKGLHKILGLLLFLSVITTHAQSYLEFVENKGQWNNAINFKGELKNGAFALQKTGYRFLLHKNEDLSAISEYMHGHTHNNNAKNIVPTSDKIVLNSHVYEVKFLNSNPNTYPAPEKAVNSYNNYYLGNDPSKWASNCKMYTAITYKNIYPNTDVRYYTDNDKLKYDFIVHPGGNTKNIALYIEGAENISIKKGELIIKTSIGEIKELKPYTYILTKKGKQEVDCSFQLKGNIVTFNLQQNIPADATIVIDPTVIFSSFTGSSTDNWGYTATYDELGNFYAGGISFGTGFPTSNGAFQTVFQGGSTAGEGAGFDISIIKFSSFGNNRLYGTYIGGSLGNEQPHSLVVDSDNNLIVAGRTNSGNTYPTTLPTVGTGGGWDIILTKLNATGTALINSRRIGGAGDDGVNIRSKYPLGPTNGLITIRRNYGDDARSEVIVDNSNNIYLASCTQSLATGGSGGFPVTAGAAQTTPGSANAAGRYQDGVVIKTSPDLSTILFSTLFGGNADDAAFVLAINPINQDIYVAGGTCSNNLPGDKTGVLFPNNQGGLDAVDGFVTVLSNNGSQILKTTYMGTPGEDIVFGVQFDRAGFPYVMGTTTGNWPVVNAIYNQTNGKQFIAKLRPDLSNWVYSTRFGSNGSIPNISPVAFLVDRCENVYVSGWGGGINSDYYVTAQTTVGLPVTPSSISTPLKATTDGRDMHFLVLQKNAQALLFGAFFGQTDNPQSTPEHVDGGTSRFDRNGIIYQSVCANCGGNATFPTTPGVWGPANLSSGRCNLAAIKIAFNFSGVGSLVQSSINGVRDTSGCVPLTVTFRDAIANASKYIWNFGDGSPDETTTTPTVQHTYNNIGNYQVTLISIDSTTCNISDTSVTTLRVRNDDAFPAFTINKNLPCTDLSYSFINNSVPPASKPFKPNSFKWDFGDGTTLIAGAQTVTHTYATAGPYTVRLILNDTNYCNSPDTAFQLLRVAPLVVAKFKTDSSGCTPYTASFENLSEGGTTFTWTFGDGSLPISSTNNIVTHSYSSPGTYVVKLVAFDANTCNQIDSTTFSLIVSPNPTAAFTYNPNPPQTNTPVNFINNSVGANWYKWTFGDGDSLVTTNINSIVSHTYNATRQFDACLEVRNNFNCRDTVCIPIQARILPLLDVPNAFTPNGDGKNDMIFVQGFGIAKMTWRIFNRWGAQVFISTNKNIGWDGRFNGVLQPQDVFNYVLDVEYSDGTRIQKKGDITLLR